GWAALGRGQGGKTFPAPDADAGRNAPAINHAAGRHPPFLILYGDMDMPRTGEDAQQMAAALKEAGNTADVHEIAGHAHMDMITGVMNPSDQALRFMLAFVGRVQ